MTVHPAVRNALRLLWIAVTATAGVFAQAAQVVAVSYSLVRGDLTVEEPVILQFSIKNGLAEDVIVWNRVNNHGYGGFRGSVIRPDGRKVEFPQPRPNEVVLGGLRTVAPQQSSTSQLLINKWVNFDMPGRYYLHVEAAQPLATANGVKLPYSTSGDVTIDIGPRDESRLSEICASLSSRLAGSTWEAGVVGPAEALGHINDPIAVPYLARIEENRHGLDGWVVEALERIGNGPAVDALLKHLNSPEEDTRVAVLRALNHVEEHTTDPAVKQRISDARR